jgi:hypothetical protein
MATKEIHHRSLAGFIGANGGLPSTPANTVVPSISGTATVGQTLTGAPGTWTGREAPALSYRWLRDDVAIAGAVALTYDLVVADQGAAIKFEVTGTNWTAAVVATSAATAAVAGA